MPAARQLTFALSGLRAKALYLSAVAAFPHAGPAFPRPPILLQQLPLPPLSSSLFWQLLSLALGFLASGLPGSLADSWLLTWLFPLPHPPPSLSFFLSLSPFVLYHPPFWLADVGNISGIFN